MHIVPGNTVTLPGLSNLFQTLSHAGRFKMRRLLSRSAALNAPRWIGNVIALAGGQRRLWRTPATRIAFRDNINRTYDTRCAGRTLLGRVESPPQTLQTSAALHA